MSDEPDTMVINGRKRRVMWKHGVPYVREAYDISADILIKFESKVYRILRTTKSDAVERLVEELTRSFGISDVTVKQPGDLYDSRIPQQIKGAVTRYLQDNL